MEPSRQFDRKTEGAGICGQQLKSWTPWGKCSDSELLFQQDAPNLGVTLGNVKKKRPPRGRQGPEHGAMCAGRNLLEKSGRAQRGENVFSNGGRDWRNFFTGFHWEIDFWGKTVYKGGRTGKKSEKGRGKENAQERRSGRFLRDQGANQLKESEMVPRVRGGGQRVVQKGGETKKTKKKKNCWCGPARASGGVYQ